VQKALAPSSGVLILLQDCDKRFVEQNIVDTCGLHGRIALVCFLLPSPLSAVIGIIGIVNHPLPLVVVVVETLIVFLAIHHLGLRLIGIGSYKLPGFHFLFTFLGFVLALALASLGFGIILFGSLLLE